MADGLPALAPVPASPSAAAAVPPSPLGNAETTARPRLPAAATHADFKAQHAAQTNSRITTVMKDCTGPSFDDRCKLAAKDYRKRAKAITDIQKRNIEEAVKRAKARPTNSPFREAALTPASVEERYKVNTQLRRQKEAEFARQAAETKRKLDSREPIFRVSEVQKAFEEQKKRQEAHRRELREEEERRWEHIRDLQNNVIHRPLLLENYQRPEHIRSSPELRLIPKHMEDTPLQQSILAAVGRTEYTDSAWGKEVAMIKARQDARPKLSEIQYPPKVFAPKPLGSRPLLPIEVQMHNVVSQGWFQKSEWAEKVRDIKQKMDDRPKLHECSYPPKH